MERWEIATRLRGLADSYEPTGGERGMQNAVLLRAAADELDRPVLEIVSKREGMAAAMLNGILAGGHTEGPLAQYAVDYADALIAELAKKKA